MVNGKPANGANSGKGWTNSVPLTPVLLGGIIVVVGLPFCVVAAPML